VKIVVDTYAWIEIFVGSEKGQKAKDYIEKATEVYTPDTVLAEVARKYLREGMKEDDVRDRLQLITEASDIRPINNEVALESARSYTLLVSEAKNRGQKAPSLFDAIILASARLLEANILTGDEHLKSFHETLWVG
jgi:predicted nucleic acid-binding protein